MNKKIWGEEKCYVYSKSVLKKDGLSLEILYKLSYQSKLGINLKKNLHYFEKNSLFQELICVNEWYDSL